MWIPILIRVFLAGLLFQADATEDILKQAIDLHQRALAIAQKSKNAFLEATTHSSLGRLKFDGRQWEDAHSHFQSALQLFQQLGDKKGQANTLLNIGRLNLITGEQLLQSAAAMFKESLR